MEISIFLGKFFGLYLIIVGGALASQRMQLKGFIKDFYKNSALMLIAGIISLIFGLLIILSHNVWEMSWRVIITILGYISLIKGLVRFYIPDKDRGLAEWFMKKQVQVWMGTIYIFLGCYLLYNSISP